MRTILFLRHAQAVLPDSSGKDFDRRLNSAGETDAENQAKRLINAGILPDFILCSPASRTRQTADIFKIALATTLPAHPVTLQEAPSLYRANAAGYIQEIRTQVPDTSRCALIVGHNPSIEDCALLFARSSHQFEQRIGYGFPTAGLAEIKTQAEFFSLFP